MTARPLELTVIDIATYVGWETILDLNEPVPDEMKQRFDLVWEGGTLEHVFDIAQALANCASMCRLGGMVFHALPMNWLNHGFYNVNPTLMVDFHEDNGFRTIGLQGSANPWRTEFFEIPFHDRFRLDGEANLIYLAERVEIRDRFVKPIQRRYRDPSRWS
jgi:SAM-dependent methyltransferase